MQVFRPIGAETETVVNALITALHDKDDRVRHSAAQSIREFGTLVDETLMP
jgi:HEAT repeat protein